MLIAEPTHYVFDDKGQPVPEPDPAKWARFFAKTRIVRQDALSNGVLVSTIFTGVGPPQGEWGPPKLWETVIFGGPCHEYEERHSSLGAALDGHEKALALATGKVH